MSSTSACASRRSIFAGGSRPKMLRETAFQTSGSIPASTADGTGEGRPARRARCASLRELDADVLRLQVRVEGLEALLASEAALLVAAERQLDTAARAVGVHVHLSGSDAVGHEQRLVDVARPHARDESVLAAVREARGLLHGAERRDGEHRAEDLLVVHAHSGLDAVQQRRIDEEAVAETGVARTRAAGRDHGALALSGLDVAHDLFE